MTNYIPLAPFFVQDEKGRYGISLNQQETSMSHLSKCKIAFDQFFKSIKKGDIEKYNEEIKKIRIEQIGSVSLTPKKKNLSGYVYILKSGIYYKIGISKNPKTRLQFYITENPNEIEIIANKKVEDSKTLEKRLHEKFKNKIHRGEWFLLEAHDVENAKDLLRLSK